MDIIIPHEYIAGFQKREKTFDGRLGFITYLKEDNTLMSSGNFNKWVDKSIPLETYNNNPQSGFTLGKTLNHHSGFGGASEQLFRIYTPNNIEIEITVENFLEIAKYGCIDKCYILEECVISWKGSRIYLLPVSSPEYLPAKEFSENLFTVDETITFEPGEIFTVKNHAKRSYIRQNVLYVGKINVFTSKDKKNLKKSNFKWNPEKNIFDLVIKPKEPQHVFIPLPSYQQKYYLDSYSDFIFDTDENLNGKNYQKVNTEDMNFGFGSIFNNDFKPFQATKENIINHDYMKNFFSYNDAFYNKEGVKLKIATESDEKTILAKINSMSYYYSKLCFLSADGYIYRLECSSVSMGTYTNLKVSRFSYNAATKKLSLDSNYKTSHQIADLNNLKILDIYKPLVIESKNSNIIFTFTDDFL